MNMMRGLGKFDFQVKVTFTYRLHSAGPRDMNICAYAVQANLMS